MMAVTRILACFIGGTYGLFTTGDISLALNFYQLGALFLILQHLQE